jgi:anti-anti-sigma factor
MPSRSVARRLSLEHHPRETRDGPEPDLYRPSSRAKTRRIPEVLTVCALEGTLMDDMAYVDTLREGDRVEVATRFTGAWVGGFQVVSTRPDGCRLRRVFDGVLLPVEFSYDQIRPELPTRDTKPDGGAVHGRVGNEDSIASSVTLRFPAELDIATVELIAQRMLDTVDRACGEVILDLDDVRFLDSYGIRLLVQIRRLAWDHDLSVRMHGGKPMVRALLDLVGVNPLFYPELSETAQLRR